MITSNEKIRFMYAVFDSCETYHQANNALKWIVKQCNHDNDLYLYMNLNDMEEIVRKLDVERIRKMRKSKSILNKLNRIFA